MRMMAVDYGDVRTGVAFCDVREMLATAYDTVEERYAPKLAEKLAALAKAEKAEQIVVRNEALKLVPSNTMLVTLLFNTHENVKAFIAIV